MLRSLLVSIAILFFAATLVNASPVVLDLTNGYSAAIEPGATIGHRSSGGRGPLILIGMEISLGTIATATFPGATQVGDGSLTSPRSLVATTTTFTLKVLASGNLYEGFMTFWGDAGDSFCCPDGVAPLPGNPNLASAAFEIIGPVTVGPTESELLADQQSFFTTLIMNHQSGNMVSGVEGNLDSLFNGRGLAPLASQSGFSFQSAGAKNWYAKRLEMAEAKKQPAALDILASQSRSNQSRRNNGSEKIDVPFNLMAYQSTNDNESNKIVEELNAVAKEDVYAADVNLSDEEAIYSPWNVWVKGSWSVYEAHDSSSFEGHIADVVGGVDYRLSDDLIIGVLGGYGIADFDTLTAGTAGSFQSDGVHVGLYLGKRLAPNLLFDALVVYTSSDYDNRSGTTTGSFSAQRVTFAAHLKGNIDWGMVKVQPTIGLMYASEKQDAYTDSAATVHAAKTVTAGRLSIGPKFIFNPVASEFGTTQFWFATKGEYDFSNQNTSATSNLPDISDVASARIQAGLSAANDSGVSLSLQGDVSGLGSGEFIAYGATAKVSVSF